MNGDYAKRIAEAVREGIAKHIESQRNGIPACGFEFAPVIRSLDLDAIIASVPQPTRQPEAAQDDRRKKWQELDYSFNAERAGLHTFHVEAFEAGLELAADWHLLVIRLGCMFDFDTLGSIDEVAASAAARRDALAKSKKPVDQENARFAIEGAIEYGRRNINPPPSDDHWLAPFWNIGRQLGAPQEQPEDERERFEAWEQRHMLERGFPPFQFEVWQAAKRDALTQAQERAAVTDEVRDLIAWLLGEGSEFPERPEKVEGKIQPLYWWRKELRRRWNGILSASSEGKKP